MGTAGNVIATSRGTGSDEKWYLYNKDVRESTSSLVDSTGAVAAAYGYDDFGNTTVRAGDGFENEICYTGQVYDAGMGLYYLNARYYNPEDGRFASQDTYRGKLDELDTLHLYSYCANNPINFVDPSGHRFVSKAVLFGYRITKYTHYNRNQYNTGVPRTEKKAKKTYKRLSYKNSLCHQFHGRKANHKYVSKNGHKEGVYWGSGRSKGKLIRNAEDKGTYNFGVGTGLKHAVLDVVPYMLWGNSYRDSTNMPQRIWVSSKEIRKSIWRKVKKALVRRGHNMKMRHP